MLSSNFVLYLALVTVVCVMAVRVGALRVRGLLIQAGHLNRKCFDERASSRLQDGFDLDDLLVSVRVCIGECTRVY